MKERFKSLIQFLGSVLGILILVVGIYFFICACTTDYIIYILPAMAVLGLGFIAWSKKTDKDLPAFLMPVEGLIVVLGGLSYYVLFLILIGLAFGVIVNYLF